MGTYCSIYIKHELGEIDDVVYQEHVRTCCQCKNILAEDDKLMQLAAGLKQPVDAGNFWPGIVTALKTKNAGYKVKRVNKYRHVLLRAAAVLAAGFVIGFYFYFQQNQIPDKGVVSLRVLQKLEEREQDYFESINELENATSEKMAQLDLNLMLLYRDKLETIDAQIEDCKEALASNPANAHIRKYLFAALKEKKDTLLEINNINPANREEDS